LREWGVHYPIDYRSHDFEKEIRRLTDGRGVQIVLDSIGGRSWLKSYRCLSPMGRLVAHGVSAMAPRPGRSIWGVVKALAGTPWLRFNPIFLANDNKGVLGLNLGHLWDRQDAVRAWADQLLEWTGQGLLDVHVDRVLKLEEAAQAHRLLQERRTKGKLILVP
jgi:NADPH:quinone reductase-like Zn-dependent oxidoreductase